MIGDCLKEVKFQLEYVENDYNRLYKANAGYRKEIDVLTMVVKKQAEEVQQLKSEIQKLRRVEL